MLTVIELELPESESSTTISKFYVHTDSEHKFYKMGIKSWVAIGFNLGSS